MKKKCAVCGEKCHAKGYCAKHYRQYWKHGCIRQDLERKKYSECRLEGCEEHHYAKGLCFNHYRKSLRLKKCS